MDNTIVCFFAGPGVRIEGENYLVLISADVHSLNYLAW